MRLVVFHNPSAGAQDHSAAHLLEKVRRAGHTVVGHVSDAARLGPLVDQGADLVVVAGGDGTVGRAAAVMSGREVAMTVLPVGTANNIAGTMGLDREHDVEAIIASWGGGRVVPFDVASAKLDGEARPFFEAYGLGFFPRFMRAAQSAGAPDDPDHKLARDTRMFADALARAPAERYAVTVDGRDLGGAYVMVEAMNIPLLGPQIAIAPGADPSDGALDVVLLDADGRDDLRAALLSGAKIALPTVRARALVVSSRTPSLRHADGELILPEAVIDRLAIRVDAGAVHMLVP